MFRSVNIYIALIVFILSITLYMNSNNKRSEFEKLLQQKYSNIPSYTQSEKDNIPEAGNPHIATYQNNFMTFDPVLGYTPSSRLISAFNERTRLINNSNERTSVWESINSNMGGRTRTLMFDPNDVSESKVWAAGVGGGLWYNNNFYDLNMNWIPVNDFWDNLSVSKIVYDPNDTQIFYVGTGEANTALITYRESSSRGVGIWKTEDGGNTWEILESTSGFEYITDIEIKNNNGISEIYASVVSGNYQGSEHLSSPSEGLFKSVDAGLTWIQVLPNINSFSVPYSPSDLEITSDGNIFVGTMKNLDGNGGAIILKSESGNINSWSIYSEYQNIIENNNENNIPGRVILTSSKNNPNFIYAVFGAGFLNNMNFNLSYGTHIIKSTNGGNNWTEVSIPTSEPNEWASLAWHALALSVHPENPNIIFAGGLELYRSLDGGQTWNDLSDWSLMYYGGGSRYIHADIHQVIFDPNNTDAIAVSTDGGLFYSLNSLTESENVIFNERNQGYNTLQFYTCDISSGQSGDFYVGGLQDNGTLGVGFAQDEDGLFDIDDMITGGDGAFCFFDDNEPILVTSTYYNAWYFFNYQTNEFEYVNNNSGVFINPSDYDSENNTLYANKVRFNGTQNNRLIKIDENFETNTINLNTNTSVYFSSVKVSDFSPNNETTLFLGTQSGRLYRVQDIDNPNAVEIGDSDFPTANISSISLGNNENEIMVTFSNYGVSSIWLTLNGGNDWIEKEGNLPDMPVRWGLLHSENNNYAMIATEIGVWETNNFLMDNVVWIPSSNGLGNVRVDMLSLRKSDNAVVAATHGRGLYHTYFTLNDQSMGDLNNDNNINVLDVVLLVNFITDNSAYSELADINVDNEVNVLDVVLLLNIILDF